jgi:hypothetical protein
MTILLQPHDTFCDHYKSSLQSHQDTWEHFTLTHAPSVVKYLVNSDHPSSASCEPSPSPCTDFASSWHLQSNWHWPTIASPTMRLLTSAPTTEAPHAFHHQLEHCHCLFITPVSAERQLTRLNNSSYSRLFSPVTPTPAMLAKRWSYQL